MKASGTTIEERRTKNGNIRSYRVKFFERGKRKSVTFRTRTDAESFVKSIHTARTIPSSVNVSAMGIIRQIQFQELCANLGIEIEKAYDEVCDILIKKYTHTAERNLSLGEAVRKFLKARKKSNCRDSTMNEYIHYLGWLKNSFGDIYPIGSITEKSLRELINSKDKISVQEHLLMRLKTFFRYLVREGFLTINPTVNITVEKVKKDEKNTAEDKNAEGEMMKSMESMIMKSVGSIFTPIIERMTESLDNLSAKMDKFGQEAPKFRSEGLDNMSAIQKSMNFEKDDNGKIELNIISQRPMVAKMIEKALTNESDDSIRKSLEADALNYMTNPYAETVGEELARYMYTKNGIKFVK